MFLREEVTISSPVVGLLSFPFLKVHFSQWYLVVVIPALGRLKEEDHAIFSYGVRWRPA